MTAFAFVAMCCVATAADFRTLEWRGGEVRIAAMPDDRRFQIEIGEGKTAKHLPLSYSVRSIEGMSIIAERLVVLGKHSHSSSIYIIDLVEAKQLLETSCFRPVASPDATYVAFERFIPRMTPLEFEWPQVQVLDVLANTPAAQALHPPTDIPDQNDPEFHSRKEHVPISPLIWSKDSRYLVYFDKEWLAEQGDTWTNSTTYFMVFEFDPATRTNTTKSVAVTVDKFVNPVMCPSTDNTPLAVKELRFVDDSVLEAVLYPDAYWAFHRFRFDLKKTVASGHLDPLPVSE